MTHSCVWHDSFIRVAALCLNKASSHYTWLTRDMTYSFVWLDSIICVTWPLHTCDMTQSYVWPDSSIHVTTLIHVFAMTHSCMCHDSFMYVPWLIHTYDVTYSYLWDESPVTCLIYVCDMSHPWHGAFMCVPIPLLKNVSFCCTGWRRPMGCFIFIGHFP